MRTSSGRAVVLPFRPRGRWPRRPDLVRVELAGVCAQLLRLDERRRRLFDELAHAEAWWARYA